jgi:hypothetical protein
MPGAWESWFVTKQLNPRYPRAPGLCNHAMGMGVLVCNQAVEDPRFVTRAPGL